MITQTFLSIDNQDISGAVLMDWLKEHRDLYKRAAMARKLGIPDERLQNILDNKAISPRYILQIRERLSKLLLHDSELVNDNAIVIKLYILALIDKYKNLPFLNDKRKGMNEKKEQIYEDLVTLQLILISQKHPLCLFMNSEVAALSKESIRKR